MNDEEKKNNIILIILVVLVCILVGGSFFFWLGTKYYEINNNTIEDNKNNKSDIDIDEKEQNIKISKEDMESLVNSLIFINPLKNYSTYEEITVKELKEEDIFYTAIRNIMANKLYNTEKFDNSEGKWADDVQINIPISLIKENLNTYFGASFDYLPDAFEYYIYYFEKNEDTYIGKTMITGILSETEYQYFLNDYQIEENKVIINVVGSYWYKGDGYYKNENSKELVISEENIGANIKEEILKYKGQLNNLQYIFEITDNGYQFKSIKIK